MNWNPVTHYQDAKVAERYDSERFSRLTGKIFDRLEKAYVARAFAGEVRTGRVVDIPCGTGRLAEVLLDLGFAVTGIDISSAMLDVARRKLARFDTRFSCHEGDVRRLATQFPASFDLALCARVLMHFPLSEQIEFLGAVASMTSGKVVITHSLSTPYHRARRRVKRAIGNPPSASYPVTEHELRTLLDGAGLVEIRRLRPSRILTEEIIVVAERRNGGTRSSGP